MSLAISILIIAPSSPNSTVHPCHINRCGAFAICLVNETSPSRHYCQCRVGYAANTTAILTNGSLCQGL